jgi:hypothetical protein
MERYEFGGVEFRCDNALNNETKLKFSLAVNELSATMVHRQQINGKECPETISIRIPFWNANLSSKYELVQLNAVHQVVLEPFEVDSGHAQVISPLFGLDKGGETHAIDSTITNWVDAGLHRHKIILQIPSYGLKQHFKNGTMHNLGDVVDSTYETLNKKQMCKMFKDPSVNHDHHMLYDLVAAYTITPFDEQISYETNETIFYKVNYAMREKLGGVGLVTLNHDDFSGSCGGEKFPLLNAVNASICAKRHIPIGS